MILLIMHCLVVTIFYCVDNHVTVILLLTEFYYIVCVIHGKTACYSQIIAHEGTDYYE